MPPARIALVATSPTIALAFALMLALTGCTDGDDEPGSVDTTNSGTPDPTQASETGGGSPTPSPTGARPSGGTPDHPQVVDATTNVFDWQSLEATTGDTVTRVGDTTITVDQEQSRATIEGPNDGSSMVAPSGFRYSDVISDGTRVVAVAQDKEEQKPGHATVIDLESGDSKTIDGKSDVPTTNGGAWTIGNGSIYHATVDGSGSYCLAQTDVASMKSTVPYCAPKRSGFSTVVVSPTATALLTFGGQPQCRTPARLDGTQAVPIEGVTECKGWDGAITPSGAVWSVVKNESRIEVGEFYASSDGGYFDLGPGTPGTLTWCGDSAYFVRDAQKDVDKARLLRWTPAGTLEVVYESPGEGAAFLADPRCAGNTLSISAFGEGGDEQVWARVP
jgi:hypothetical protein